jgi:hypothetical protein
MQVDLERLYRDSLVWDAHSGVFPGAEVDLNLLDEWARLGVSYLSINVGFDVMEWQATLATLSAYRRWVIEHSDNFYWSARCRILTVPARKINLRSVSILKA